MKSNWFIDLIAWRDVRKYRRRKNTEESEETRRLRKALEEVMGKGESESESESESEER